MTTKYVINNIFFVVNFINLRLARPVCGESLQSNGFYLKKPLHLNTIKYFFTRSSFFTFKVLYCLK